MQEWLIFCLKRKWCWKGNNIFTINRDFQRIWWTLHFSTIFNWIAPEHYVTLQLKNHSSSTFTHLISFVLFVRSLQDGQNHLLATINSSGSKVFLWIQVHTKLKGGWSYQIFVPGCYNKSKRCKWLVFREWMKWYCLPPEICLLSHQLQFVKFQEHLFEY